MATTTVSSTPIPGDSPRPLVVDVAKAAKILSIRRSSVYQLIWNEQLTPVEQFVADRIAAERP